MTQLINYHLAELLGECEDWSLSARVEEKGNKGVRVSCCEGDEERAQVGSGGNKD